MVDAEIYTVSLEAGERVDIFLYAFGWFPSSGQDDIDVKMFPTGSLDERRMVASSTNPAGYFEDFSFTSPVRGEYQIFVHGWAVTRPIQFVLYTSSSDPSTPDARFHSQGTYLATAP